MLLGIILNMYKTSFCIDVGSNQWITIIYTGRLLHSLLDTDFDYATSVKTVSADNVAIDLTLIERCQPSREVVCPDKFS